MCNIHVFVFYTNYYVYYVMIHFVVMTLVAMVLMYIQKFKFNEGTQIYYAHVILYLHIYTVSVYTNILLGLNIIGYILSLSTQIYC